MAAAVSGATISVSPSHGLATATFHITFTEPRVLGSCLAVDTYFLFNGLSFVPANVEPDSAGALCIATVTTTPPGFGGPVRVGRNEISIGISKETTTTYTVDPSLAATPTRTPKSTTTTHSSRPSSAAPFTSPAAAASSEAAVQPVVIPSPADDLPAPAAGASADSVLAADTQEPRGGTTYAWLIAGVVVAMMPGLFGFTRLRMHRRSSR